MRVGVRVGVRWPYLLAGQASSRWEVGDVLRGDAPQDRHQVGDSSVPAVAQQLCSTTRRQQHTRSVSLSEAQKEVSSRRLERSRALAADMRQRQQQQQRSLYTGNEATQHKYTNDLLADLFFQAQHKICICFTQQLKFEALSVTSDHRT